MERESQPGGSTGLENDRQRHNYWDSHTDTSFTPTNQLLNNHTPTKPIYHVILSLFFGFPLSFNSFIHLTTMYAHTRNGSNPMYYLSLICGLVPLKNIRGKKKTTLDMGLISFPSDS